MSGGLGPTGGELNSAIANATVRIHSRHVGRGPSRAQAFFRHNVVVVLFEDVMTREEHALTTAGHGETSSRLRRELHGTMRADLVGAVEELTGCRVVAFMSDNHFDPDLAVNLFVLDRWVPGQRRGEAEQDAPGFPA